MNAAAIYIQVPVWICVSFLLGIYLGVESLGHAVILHVIVWGTAKFFSKVTGQIYLSSAVCEGSVSPHLPLYDHLIPPILEGTGISLWFWLHLPDD